MPVSRWLRVALPAALLLLASTASVVAQTNVTERVTDLVGVLDDAQRSVAEDAIAELDGEANIQLWALYVGSTGGMGAPEYADASAQESGLGANNALLVVALDDRRYGLWVGPALDEITNDEIDEILANELVPQLRDEAYGEAIAATARGLGAAAGAEPDGGQGGETPAPGGQSGDGFNAWPWIAIAAIGLGGWLLWRWWRQRRGAQLEEEERDRQTGKLAREANALLVDTDEKVRQDEQELGFAEAQFGAEEAERFRGALASARDELKAAFTIRQRLDDGEPETAQQRQQMLTEIIERCRRAQATLDEQTERFRELRDLERRAPEIIGEERTALEALESRLRDAEAAVERMHMYAESAWRPVAGHVVEAGKRIALARELGTAGEAAITAGDRKRAARSAKAMQDARAQAKQLLDAIDTLERTLHEAEQSLPAAIADVRDDLSRARAADADEQAGGSEAIVELQRRLAAAEAAAAGKPLDPLEARRLVTEANAAADALLASQRESVERREREASALRTAREQASAEIDRASDFVAARRAGVGRRARTQIAEAQRHLAASHAASDHATALAEAQRATELAKAALASARADFDLLETSSRRGTILVNGEPYGPWQTGRRRTGPGWGDGDLAGDIIGGIIGGILAGGGRGGGGFGGFGGGGFGGSSGGGGIFGGGGGGGGGRSFGGGFGGGGGGRSRGGGW